MEQAAPTVVFVVFFAIAVVTLSIRRSWLDSGLDAAIEALENFRGGPPTPRHPLPADDGGFLRKSSRKVKIEAPPPF
jgi:hypothetical protein